MEKKLDPFNISLLILSPQNTSLLKEVKVNDIFLGANTKEFHPEGLFSVDIFNKYGSEQRNRTFGYINFKVPVFHPVVYKAITDLKELYGEIMSGTSYAVFNDDEKDFIKTTPLDGQTGYSFFLKHFKDINFKITNSSKREYNIKLVEKFKDNCLMSNLIVMPAGLRDFEVDEYGKPSEDEVNTFYRKAISYSSLVTEASLKINPEAIDGVRYNLQSNLVNLYNHIKNLLEGKKKLILGKWASRKVFNGTRNVITSDVATVNELNDITMVDCNQTVVGLFQYLKATLPVSMYQIKNGFIAKALIGPNDPAILVNKKTLKSERVEINSDYFDDWMSDEGLEKTINYFGEEDLRHEPLTIANHYVGLIYKGLDKTYKVFQDIDNLPDGYDKSLVTPLTFCELLYLSIYKQSHTYPAYFTRYPITGNGSIYPTYPYLKTTIRSEVRTELDDSWNKTTDIAIQFPITNEMFVNSMSPHKIHLSKLGADSN